MDVTLFLAQLWGPVLLAVGLGVFFNKNYYIKIYRDLEKNSLAVLSFGIVMMTAGIAQVLFQNVWNTLPEILVSFIGWGMVVKGIAFIVFPNAVDKAGDRWAKFKLIPVAGGAMLLIGGYLTYFAYLA